MDPGLQLYQFRIQILIKTKKYRQFKNSLSHLERKYSTQILSLVHFYRIFTVRNVGHPESGSAIQYRNCLHVGYGTSQSSVSKEAILYYK
jgi:hypothetical protein